MTQVSDTFPAFVIESSSHTEVSSEFTYRVEDPFAVTMSLGGVVWTLSRELLRAGLDGPAGDGDVRLWPTHGTSDALFLHLRSPFGEALLELPREKVAGFVRRTERLVSFGSEVIGDEELNALLGGRHE